MNSVAMLDYQLAKKYIKHIQPRCNPVTQNMFVAINGKPIADPNKNIQWSYLSGYNT